MAAKLEPGKTIKRLVKIYGVEGLVEVSLNSIGVNMRVPGTKKRLTATWEEVVAGMYTPQDCKSYHAGEPMRFLKDNATAVMAKKARGQE